MDTFTLLATAVLAAAAMPSADQAALTKLVDRFEAARSAFDPPAIAQFVAPDYVEISPIGEVDPRDKMLSFYTPDKRTAAPPMTLSERDVRVHGSAAIVTTRLSYGSAAMRVVYVARRNSRGWLLESAQYTPIRPPRPTTPPQPTTTKP